MGRIEVEIAGTVYPTKKAAQQAVRNVYKDCATLRCVHAACNLARRQ